MNRRTRQTQEAIGTLRMTAENLMLADYIRMAIIDVLDEVERLERAIYDENARGGEARAVVARIGRHLGVDLTRNVLGGDIWSPENMDRAYEAVRVLKREEW